MSRERIRLAGKAVCITGVVAIASGVVAYWLTKWGAPDPCLICGTLLDAYAFATFFGYAAAFTGGLAWVICLSNVGLPSETYLADGDPGCGSRRGKRKSKRFYRRSDG